MKKILAAVTAILMLSALTACGNDGNSAEVINEVTSSEVLNDVNFAETQAAEAGDDLYSGNGYTVKVDSEKWMDASEYVKMISEYAEDNNLSQNLTAEDIQNMNDGMFYHTNGDGTNFNIVCNAIGNTDGVSIGDGAEIIKEQYEASGITWLDSEVVTINGLEWLKINVEMSMEDTNMKMLQCMALADGNQYVMTYTAAKDKYGETVSDFEEVLNSFKFSE